MRSNVSAVNPVRFITVRKRIAHNPLSSTRSPSIAMEEEDSMITMKPQASQALGRIDHYELERKLGGGGFGVVYLAKDTVSGIEVAVKTLHPMIKHSPEEMENLREKFVLVSRLAHPNIATALSLHPVRECAIHDETTRKELLLSPGDFVLVMRYAPGVPLSKWKKQFPEGRVPLKQTLEIGRQVASALDCAHEEKIVHRDIKPANLMVETLPDGRIRVRVLDFGLASEIRSSMARLSMEKGDTSGTRPYMAPEQWKGRRQDGRTDQYALACVLYELLTGEPPFAGVFETGDPIIMKTTVENDDPIAVDDVPDCVNEAFAQALSKEPETRFATCGKMIAVMSGKEDSYRMDEIPSPSSSANRIRPSAPAAVPFQTSGANSVQIGAAPANPVYVMPTPNPAPAPTPGSAITSLVLGIIGILLFVIPLFQSIILGIIGIRCAVSAKRKTKPKPCGIAMAGMICSIVAIVLNALVMLSLLADDDEPERQYHSSPYSSGAYYDNGYNYGY